MANLIADKLKSQFVKNFAMLLLSGGFAQLIPFFLAPFISRYFSPENIALHGLYFSVVSILSVVATGKLESAILIPKSDQKALNLLFLAFVFSVATSVLLGIGLFFFDDLFSEKLSNESFSSISIWIPISVFLIGVYQAVNYWLIRKGEFKKISFFKVSQRIFESGATLITGFSSISIGLILSDTIGRLAVALRSLYSIRQVLSEYKLLTLNDAVELLKEYKKYLIHFAPSSFANAFSSHLVLFVISAKFDEMITGQFNFVRLVLATPFVFFGQHLSQILLERFSKKARSKQKMMSEFYRLMAGLSGISVILIAVVYFFGEALFVFGFGEEWQQAGFFSRIIVFSVAIKFIASPLSASLNSINFIKSLSIWQWSYFFLMLLLIPVSNYFETPESLLLIYVAIDTIAYLAYLATMIFSIKKFERINQTI